MEAERDAEAGTGIAASLPDEAWTEVTLGEASDSVAVGSFFPFLLLRPLTVVFTDEDILDAVSGVLYASAEADREAESGASDDVF